MKTGTKRYLQSLFQFWTARKVALVLLLIGFAVIIVGSSNVIQSLRDFIAEFYSNVGTEFVSIALTVLVIDWLNEKRDESHEKERLIREMNNQDNGIVMRAVEELRARGWLEDGSLADARLGDANLRNVNLKRANLKNVRFLTDKQLVQAQRLWLATMPDGSRYNGRFNLPADLARAQEHGVDINDPSAFARDYQIPVKDYLVGQEWARKNLTKVLAESATRRDEVRHVLDQLINLSSSILSISQGIADEID